nr:RNA-directed DNA polymerase, eukaryota [Tanacetum cinerariifolium]
MGDFNEVRTSDERRGSSFNPYRANYFDRFIVNSGLIDVTLEEKIDKAMDIGVVDDCTVLRRIELKNNLLKLTEMEAKDRPEI